MRSSRFLLARIRSATAFVEADDMGKVPLEPRLQDLETSVNGFASRLPPVSPARPYLLSHQLRLLQRHPFGSK